MYDNTQYYLIKGIKLIASVGTAWYATTQIIDNFKFRSINVLASMPIKEITQTYEHAQSIVSGLLGRDPAGVTFSYAQDYPFSVSLIANKLGRPSSYFRTVDISNINDFVGSASRHTLMPYTFEDFLRLKDIMKDTTKLSVHTIEGLLAQIPGSLVFSKDFYKPSLEHNREIAQQYLSNIQNFKAFILKTVAWASLKSWALGKVIAVAEACLTSKCFDAFGKIEDNNFVISRIQHGMCDRLGADTYKKMACVEATNLLFAIPKSYDSTAHSVVELAIKTAELVGAISPLEHAEKPEL